MARYVALVDGRSGSYGLTVPDLPGCTSGAATIDEFLRRATEAVRLWAEDALADGEKLPKPRSIEAVRADPEVAAALAHDAVLAIVCHSACSFDSLMECAPGAGQVEVSDLTG